MAAASLPVTVSMGMDLWQKTLIFHSKGHRRPLHFQRTVDAWSFYGFLGREVKKTSNIDLFHWWPLLNPMYDNSVITQGPDKPPSSPCRHTVGGCWYLPFCMIVAILTVCPSAPFQGKVDLRILKEPGLQLWTLLGMLSMCLSAFREL